MNIYVGNLPLDLTEEALRQEFAAFGQVSTVSIMNDKYIGSGQARGYGFVEMTSRTEAESAVSSLNGKLLNGRVIIVITALPLSDNNTGFRPSRKVTRFNPRGRQRVF